MLIAGLTTGMRGRTSPLLLACAAALACVLLASGIEAREAERKYRFDVREPTLGAALATIAEQTDLVVLFPFELASMTGMKPVVGEYTVSEAIRILFRDTQFSGGLTDRGVIYISLAPSHSANNGESDMSQRGSNKSFWSAVAGVLFGVGAHAQDAAPSETLEEVLVTATKRVTRLQDTPISITALGDVEIGRRGLVDRGDYLRSVPGVNLIDQGPGMNTVMMRGVYGDYFRTGPTVGIYLGDIPLTGNSLGASSDITLEDIERVEVLRGPQGTLYGSNALSGAIRYIPHAPDPDRFAARVAAGYSETGRYGGANTKLQSVVNLPLLPGRLAVRAVGFRHDNEGYYRNVAGTDAALQAAAASYGARNLAVNKNHRGATNYTGGRLSVLWHASDFLSITATYLKQKTAQEDRPFEMTQFGAYRLSEYQLGHPAAGEDALQIDLDIANVTAELDFGWGSLLSSSSWIRQDSVRNWDIGTVIPRLPSGLPPITQLSITNAEVFSQELRFTSNLSGPFKFVAGLYYENNDQPYRQPTYFAGDPALNPYPAQKMWDASSGRWVTQKAAFGEVTYSVTDKLALTIGGRAFDYDTRFKLHNFDAVVIVRNGLDDNEANESGQTYKAGVEFKPRDNALLYATWAQGFRLGRPLNSTQIRSLCDQNEDGVLDGTNISSTLNIVASDTLDSYELGTKLSSANGRATLSSALYYNDWTDVPVTLTPPGCLASTTINGGAARARGVELEATLRPIDMLRIGFGVGYVDTELTATSSAGREGDRMNFTPELNGNFSLEYDLQLAGHDSFVRGDYMYYGNSYTDTGERGEKVPGYGLVNLTAGMQLNRIDVQFQVSNLLNSDAITTLAPGLGGFPARYALRLRPRTVGITLGYRF